MSLIYRYAWLTVCAMNTGSCLDHFLKRPPPEHSIPIPFRSNLHTGVDDAYWVRWHTMITSDILQNRTHFEPDDEASRWMTRGWTLQEMCLSSNSLLSGKHKMHYQTGKWVFSEGSDLLDYGRLGSSFDLEMLREDDEQFISGWLSFMEKASRRNLTKSTDKLPSVSGMTRITIQNCPQQYLTGIRKDRAHRDLMWSQQTFSSEYQATTLTAVVDSLENQEPYITPSWNWASRDAAINGWTQTLLLETGWVQGVEKEYKSMEADTFGARANPFGEVVRWTYDRHWSDSTD